jgi:hypothetical protein
VHVTRGPSPLTDLIGTFLRENNLRSGGGCSPVFKAWDDVLEPGLRKHATPVRFRSGELSVEVDSATHLQELKNFTGENYRRKANQQLGKATIRKVVFKLRG